MKQVHINGKTLTQIDDHTFSTLTPTAILKLKVACKYANSRSQFPVHDWKMLACNPRAAQDLVATVEREKNNVKL